MFDQEKNVLKGDPKVAYTVTYYRKDGDPCEKHEANAVIIHEYDHYDTLVGCAYRKLSPV